MGSYWWDELALSGAAHAVLQGLQPAVDFWVPFVFPVYLKAFAQWLVGPAAAYVAECLLQGTLVLAVLHWLFSGRQVARHIWLVGVWAVLQATLPFNIGSVVQAAPGSVVFASAYNRLGGALITLAWVALAIRPKNGSRTEICWWAFMLSLAFLVKVTACQVIWASLVLHALLCPTSGERRLVVQSTLLTVAAMLPLLWLSGMGEGYLGALKDLSDVRLSLLRERLDVTRMILSDHRHELFALVLIAALLAARGTLTARSWAGGVTWYLFSLALLLGYMVSNFGDNGLFPAVALVAVVLWAQRPKPGVPDGRVARLLFVAASRLWLVGTACFVTMLGYWITCFVISTHLTQLEPLPVRTAALAARQQVDVNAWEARPPIHVPGAPFRLDQAKAHAAYAEGLDEALQYLDANVGDHTKSVYALDFPAYAFAMLGGYRVPTHTYPWMLYGHEVTIDVHPAPDQLFGDVDVLMVTRCSLAGRNRKLLAAIYRLEIQRHWYREVRLKCWDVYRRAKD
jgi:hypothetical protein